MTIEFAMIAGTGIHASGVRPASLARAGLAA